jgi:hypothetical protein
MFAPSTENTETKPGSEMALKQGKPMTKQNRIGLIVTAAVLGTVVTTSAMAAPQQYCQNYAALAVVQSSAMQGQNLGCTGFRWHNWYEGHYQWCSNVSETSAFVELLVRQNAIGANGPC